MNLPAQLLDCKHFCWQAGMLGFSPSEKRYQRCAGAGVWVDAATGHGRLTPYPDLVLVLTDAPTQGALLQLVQEAYKAPYAYVKRDAMSGPNTGKDYFVGGLPDLKSVWSSGVGETLAKALLEAP